MPKNQMTNSVIESIIPARPFSDVRDLQYRVNGIGPVTSDRLSAYVGLSKETSKHAYRHKAFPPKPRTKQSTPLSAPSYHVNYRSATPLVVVPQAALEPEG